MCCPPRTNDSDSGRHRDVLSTFLVLLFAMTIPGTPPGASGSLELARFESGTAEPGWFVVNDNVMGGRSKGGFEVDHDELVFTGDTNTNGGGFSSIRTEPIDADLSAFDGIRLRVRGDGRQYTWRLTTDARWRGREVAYWATFETEGGLWTTVDIPFSRFVPRFRGSRLDGPPLNRGKITGMGLMIYDGQDGPFELRLAEVQAFAAGTSFSLDQHRWKKRIIVVNARDANDPGLSRLLDELAAANEEFTDRDLLLVTLLKNGKSTVGDQALSTASAAALRKDLEIDPDVFALRLIGKDGTVKLSEESAVPLADIYALIDTMPMRQNEMSRD